MPALSITQVAGQLGVSVQAVHKMIETKRLKARRIGYFWVVDSKAVDRLDKISKENNA